MRVCVLSRFSCVQLSVAPWTIAHQASLSMDSPGKNTRVDCHALLQGNLPNLRFEPVSYVSCINRWVLYHWCHLESPQMRNLLKSKLGAQALVLSA